MGPCCHGYWMTLPSWETQEVFCSARWGSVKSVTHRVRLSCGHYLCLRCEPGGDKYLNKRRLHWLGRKLTDLLSYEKYICGTFFFVCVFVFPSIISSPLHNIFSVWHRSLLHTLVLPFLNTYSLSCLNWFFWSSCHFDLETLFFRLQDVPQRGTESGEGAGLHLWLKMLKMSLLLELATKTGEERTENLTWTKQALTWRSDCVSI